MNRRFTSYLFAAVLALALAVPAFPQEQQPSKDQSAPNSSAPPSSAPQTPSPQTPPGSDTQSAAPSQGQQGENTSTPEPQGPKENGPAPQQQPPATTPERSAPESTSPAKPKPRSRKSTHSRKHKKPAGAQSKASGEQSSSAPQPSAEPGKVVVRNGGAKDDVVHLSPGGTQEQEAHNRENTAQLLATTDENLKRLAGRQLSPTEQSTLDQIHSYMRQAKSAEDSGDLARAHTLAFKAHLLSDDLAKR